MHSAGPSSKSLRIVRSLGLHPLVSIRRAFKEGSQPINAREVRVLQPGLPNCVANSRGEVDQRGRQVGQLDITIALSRVGHEPVGGLVLRWVPRQSEADRIA